MNRVSILDFLSNKHISVPNFLYPFILKWEKRCRLKPEAPIFNVTNTVLKYKREYLEAIEKIEKMGLYPHRCKTKNWDALASLNLILSKTEKNAYVLDAGGHTFSPLVDWLYLYGYRNLKVANIAFDGCFKRGPIEFKPDDITKSNYKNDYFDVVTCLSVIEHGVNLDLFFKEMYRILKRNGLLIISTDFWCDNIDTKDKIAYGCPVKVFNKDEIKDSIRKVEKKGWFSLQGDIDFRCCDKVVNWERMNLNYTFLFFFLTKV